MKKPNKTLVALLGAAALTTGTYFGVGHGLRTYWEHQMVEANKPVQLYKQCDIIEQYRNGDLHHRSEIQKDEYLIPQKNAPKKPIYPLPKESEVF